MTEKAIANSFAFPCSFESVQDGMTYRQWLVGIIAAGLVASPNLTLDIAGTAVDYADAVIRRLAAERTEEAKP